MLSFTGFEHSSGNVTVSLWYLNITDDFCCETFFGEINQLQIPWTQQISFFSIDENKF